MNSALKISQNRKKRKHRGSWDAGDMHTFIKQTRRKGDLVNINVRKIQKIPTSVPKTVEVGKGIGEYYILECLC